ncbi:hypothetical protein L596_025855 [Steinernema carpocapsae]|uniref:Uncharacterized protein n=1 Tax=Steinernema carpocapsae TaxID=34508 RepID=A0A4U5M908_STECR|nr:hypothetical protein L596_025855 [Steinernema carpocapsae]
MNASKGHLGTFAARKTLTPECHVDFFDEGRFAKRQKGSGPELGNGSRLRLRPIPEEPVCPGPFKTKTRKA